MICSANEQNIIFVILLFCLANVQMNKNNAPFYFAQQIANEQIQSFFAILLFCSAICSANEQMSEICSANEQNVQ